MEGQLSSTPSISQSYSFIATDEAESIVAAVEAAENNISDKPPGLGSGGASAPQVNFQEGYAKGNPPCSRFDGGLFITKKKQHTKGIYSCCVLS